MGSCSSYSYAWPSTVHVANFVTVKPCLELEGEDEIISFKIWKEQMLCLLESQDVSGFVDGQIIMPDSSDVQKYKLWRRTDRLVKGWILGSIGRDALDAVWEKETAMDVWLELLNIFNNNKNKKNLDHKSSASGDLNRYLELYQAALRGDWEKADEIFKKDKKELATCPTSIISADSETALHVAVLTGKANIEFVKKLVKSTRRDGLSLQDCYGDTALHNAGIVGNTEAARALVDANPELLYIRNNENQLAVTKAAIYCHKETLSYLISKYDDKNMNSNNYPFKGRLGIDLMNAVIASEFLDIALDLATKHPNLAGLRDGDGDSALSTIAETDTIFPRTETFSWSQKFIYNRIPVKKATYEDRAGRDVENLNNNSSTSFQSIRPYFGANKHQHTTK